MPSSQDWYVHVQGETFGPLATETVLLLLKQNRLLFTDFIWTDNLTKWVRVSDIDAFMSALPSYPGVPIPSSSRHSESPPRTHAPAAPAPAPIPTQPRTKSAPPPPAPAPENVPMPGTIAVKNFPIPRRFERVPIDAKLSAKITSVEGQPIFKVLNIGEGGLFFSCPSEVEIGVDLQFTLESTALEKPLEMTGTVVRKGEYDGKSGYGLSFTRVNPAHKRQIAEYVRDRAAPKT